MRLIQTEANDLFAAIEMGWAVPVKAASHKNEQCEYSFYRLNDKVYSIYYIRATTVSECYEVTGENLEMFNIHYKQEVVA